MFSKPCRVGDGVGDALGVVEPDGLAVVDAVDDAEPDARAAGAALEEAHADATSAMRMPMDGARARRDRERTVLEVVMQRHTLSAVAGSRAPGRRIG
jgi:hypothetical protein